MTVRRLALLLSFSIGFVSLSQEIAWVRIVGLGQQARPQAFSLVLSAFLLGIAFGAIAGRRICTRSSNVLRAAGWVLVIAAAVDFATLYMLSTPLAVTLGSPRRLAALLFIVALNAGLKGILFPIVHHLGGDAAEGRVGRSVSRVYLGNVLGATLGPIVTGFWLLDHVSVEGTFALIGGVTAVLGILALVRAGLQNRWLWAAPIAVAAVGAFAVVQPPGIVANIAANTAAGGKVSLILQNKHGVIHMVRLEDPKGGDITFGGNAYDGRVSTDLRVNSNGLERAYVMAAMHPHPRRALIIGLSTGAWAAVIRGMPGIEVVDVVEINPGYLDVMRHYPEVTPVLSDPRIHIHIDDGRRWLRAHPQARYDLIFQNTTWHWRAYSTLLLSKEYFAEVAKHLNPDGILAVNGTSSPDVYVTARSVFPHVGRLRSFAYMSFQPLIKRPDAEAVLRACSIWGEPAFSESQFAPGALGASLARDPLESAEEYLRGVPSLGRREVISDLNMVTEYRHGSAPPFGWLAPLLPPRLPPPSAH